jgi:hypothetical protein
MIPIINSTRLCFGAFEYYTAYSTLALLLRNKNIWRLLASYWPNLVYIDGGRNQALNYPNRF